MPREETGIAFAEPSFHAGQSDSKGCTLVSEEAGRCLKVPGSCAFTDCSEPQILGSQTFRLPERFDTEFSVFGNRRKSSGPETLR